MNQYYLSWRAGALYRAIHVRDGAQLVELTRVACKLKLTFAPLVVMIRQVHGAFPASTNSTPTWVSENNPSIDGGRVSTTCGRNPGFQAERGFLVRLIQRNSIPTTCALLNFSNKLAQPSLPRALSMVTPPSCGLWSQIHAGGPSQ